MTESLQPKHDPALVAGAAAANVAGAAEARALPSPNSDLPVGTVTFLFSDVVGSSPVTEQRGDRSAREFYRRHDRVIRRLAAEFEGHIVRQDGDGFFISFRSTRQALRCAIGIQRGLVRAYDDELDRVRVRIGLHVGETIEEGGDYYGSAVNMAARVRGEAGADQIVVTDLVRALASGEPEFRYRFLVETALRGFQGRVKLYELLWREGEIAEAINGDGAPEAVAPNAAELRRYSQALAAWCTEDDLSEWAGRYVRLTGRVEAGRGVLSTHEARLTLDLQELIDRYPRLIIAGEGGSGKTTALLEATRRAAEAIAADSSEPLPVFMQLRTWRPGQDFVDLAQESMAARGLVRSRESIIDWLQTGRCLLVLDGLNEIIGSAAETEALMELDSLPYRFPRCRLIISTREHRVGEHFAELPLVAIRPLRPHDVLQYILQYVSDGRRAEAIFVSLGGRDRAAWLQSDSLISLARNPLMLNVIISHELTGGGAVRPSRAAVLTAFSRHTYRTDLLRGSRLAPEVKEALLACIAFDWRQDAKEGPQDRGVLAQTVRDALARLKQEELIAAGVDATTVLAEIDRRFFSPLLPKPGQVTRYDWSHQLFQDYFVALDLRRRHFPVGQLVDRRGLEELFAGEGWYRWAGAAIFLSEVLDDIGVLALIDVCLRADNLILTCRCLSHSVSGGVRWRGTPGVAASRLAELLRRRTADEDAEQRAQQDPYVVLCEALLEREPEADGGVESLEACLGTAILSTVSDVDAAGVLATLSLGLTQLEVGAIAWSFGRDAREVLLLRARLRRLGELPCNPGSTEQQLLRQGMLLALAASPEVLLVELCRRIQLLTNADRAAAPQARALAGDTIGVHAPLARKLGLWRLAGLLEDLSLYVLDPDEFERTAALAEDLRLVRRERRLDWLGDVLSEHLQALSIDADVQTAMPNLSGIAAELRRLGELRLPRAALRGLGRVVVNVASEEDCDRVMAALEELWPGTAPAEPDLVPLTPAVPREGRHELVAYPSEGGFVRVLVQTVPADEITLDRRWTGESANHSPLRARMQRVLEGLVQAGDTERVFVLTSIGEVVALPLGSTPLDFAYHIHTRLGHRATGALVNGKPEPLTYELRHGDRVEIQIDPQRDLPPAEWLERPAFIHTPRARKAVQQALEAARRADAITFGRSIVEEELSRVDGESNLLPGLLKTLGFQREEKLFEAAGRGEVARREIAFTVDVLRGNAEGGSRGASVNADLDASDRWAPIVLGSTEALRPRYARCCRPQPGDPIRGYQTGQSVVVHHAACPVGVAEAATHAPIEVRWPSPERAGTVLVRVRARKGRTVAPAIRRAAAEAGIEVVDLASSRAVEGEITLTLECRASEQEVQPLLARLKRLAEVSSVDLVVQTIT